MLAHFIFNHLILITITVRICTVIIMSHLTQYITHVIPCHFELFILFYMGAFVQMLRYLATSLIAAVCY